MVKIIEQPPYATTWISGNEMQYDEIYYDVRVVINTFLCTALIMYQSNGPRHCSCRLSQKRQVDGDQIEHVVAMI